MATKLYPIGMQTFSEIREEDFLYVDKTEYIYRMTHTSGKYFFLSRPRRFGKSLLVSTFESYFEGKKELFKGLAIEKLEKDWTEYPVLHFSLAGGKHMEKDQLVRYLLYILKVNEEKLYAICASAELSSEHPLGKAVVRCFKNDHSATIPEASDFKMIPGRGVSANVEGYHVLAGNMAMLNENNITVSQPIMAKTEEYINRGCTITYVALDNEFAGYVILSDTIRALIADEKSPA